MNSLIANNGVRFSIVFVLGIITAFTLTVLMHLLISSSNGELDEQPVRKISDICQPERQVNENSKEVKPDKPENPETPPELPEQTVDIQMDIDAINITPNINVNLDIGLGLSLIHI